MHDTPELSIVIPAYQEAAIIESSLDSLADYLDRHPFQSVEIVVVVANSPDGTARLARGKAHKFDRLRVVEPGSRVGKGRDTRYGMLEATGRYRVYMDADLATPLHHLEDVRRAIQERAHIAIAVRNLLSIHDGFGRKLMSKGANWAAQILVVPGIKDTQCGFKLFSAEAAEAIFTRQTMLKWSFDMELLGIARYLKYDITTFEAPDWHDPKEAAMGLVGDSIYRIVLNGLMDPFKIRWNIWAGRYRKPSYIHASIED